MVEAQDGFYFGFIPRWTHLPGPFPQIISFIIFLIAGFAETNRVPFDLPEAENELVAGFHTEYSSMKFAAFFMAEYANMITVSVHGDAAVPGRLAAAVPGGVRIELRAAADLRRRRRRSASITACNPARRCDRITLPGVRRRSSSVIAGAVPDAGRCRRSLMPLFWFCAKTGFLLFVFIWIRGTLPRFRYDQLMGFAWKFLFPVAMLNLLVTGLAGGAVRLSNMDVILFLALRGDRGGLRHQPGGADAPDFERAVAGRRDGLAGGAVPAAGRASSSPPRR